MPTEDGAAIADLVSRYCDAVAAADEDGFRSCWAIDARWTGPGLDKTGVDAIVRAWSTLRARVVSAVQEIEYGRVDLQGSTATGTWHIRERVVPVDGPPRETVGRYDDEYVLGDDGTWRFAARAFTPVPAGS